MHVGHPAKYTKYASHYTTITSMATPQQQNPQFQEGRLLLSINAYKQGQFPSFRKATSTYDIARTTAQRRVKGIQPKRGSITSNRRLTATQEESLKQWILLMDRRGMPPRVAIVRQMAGLLAACAPGLLLYNLSARNRYITSSSAITTYRPNLTENITISVLNAKILY